MTTLSDYQSLLETRYAALVAERSDTGYPVFALEHGLTHEQVVDLHEKLDSDLSRSRALNNRHWLCWIAIASEIGYEFDGNEYWYTFAGNFAKWYEFGSRDAIRNAFRSFKRQFSGALPVGRWAEHFTIIAWPITHSILPRDLQSHFAELLYDCRYDLARSQHLDAHAIGELLAEYGPDPDSRFGALLQQTELVGRLVFALRHEGVEGVVSPIEATTLKRIVGDLEKKRRARDWLHEARKVMRDATLNVSAKLHNSKTGINAGTTAQHRQSDATSRLAAARRANGDWVLGASFPDIKSILESAHITPAALGHARFRLPSETETWRPGNGLVSLSRKLQLLKTLPPDRRLVAFDGLSPEHHEILTDALSIRDKPPWILRVHTGGIALQALGHHISPGNAYVLVCAAPLASDVVAGLSLPTAKEQQGHFVYYYQAPPNLSEAHVTALARAGFGYALGATIDPIGILPRLDMTSDASIWLPSDEVILRLSAVYPVAEFSISIDKKAPTRIPVPGGSSEILVSIGKLPIGKHSVEISALASQSISLSKAQQDQVLRFEIRSPKPQRDSSSTIAGVMIALDPMDAKLDELLAKKATITIVGPAGRKIDVAAEFYDVNGHKRSSYKLADKALPIEPNWILQKLEKLKDDAFFDEMQSSPKISISFSAEELGSSYVTFSTSVDPIRWRLSKSGKKYIARMIDEADSADRLTIARYAVVMPDKRVLISVDDAIAGFEIVSPGALFEVTVGSQTYRTMICPPPSGEKITLSELLVEPVFTNGSAIPSAVRGLADLHELWSEAKTLGPFAPVYKWKTTQEIEALIARALCGPDWVEAATWAVQTQDFQNLQSKVGNPGFALQVRKIFQGDGTLRSHFETFIVDAGRYQVCSDRAKSRLALTVAFEPPSRWPSEIAATGENLAAVAAKRALIRAAFFARAVATTRMSVRPEAESAA